MSPRRQLLAAFSGYLALAVLLHAPSYLGSHLANVPPPGIWRHDAVLNAFLMARNAPALFSGGLDAMLQTGAFHPMRNTLLMTEPMLGWSLLAWPLTAVGMAPLAAHNVLWLLALAGNGLGCFALARHLTRHAGAAFLAGLPVAFSSHSWSEGPRLQILFVGAIALTLLCLERVAREPTSRHTASLAAAVGAQILLGFYQSLFLVTTVGLWLVLRPVAYGWRNALTPGSIRRLAAGLALPFLLASPLLVRYLGERDRLGLARSEAYVERTSPPLRNLIRVQAASSWVWGSIMPCGKYPANEPHFPGLVAILLAMGGVALALQRQAPEPAEGASDGPPLQRVVGHYALLLSALGVLMLGPSLQLPFGVTVPGPYKLLYWVVPGWKGVRLPGRLGGTTEVCLGVLVACGAVALAARARRWQRLGGTLVLAALGALMIVEYIPAPSRLGAPLLVKAEPAYARFLRGQPGDGAVVELPTKRAEPKDPMRDSVAMLAAWTHGRPLVNGHLGADPPAYIEAADALDQFPAPVALATARNLGVHYFVVHEGGAGAGVAGRASAAASATGAPIRLLGRFPEDGVAVYVAASAAD